MAVTINADTTNGLVITPDTSGDLSFQSSGSNIFTIDSSGNTVFSGALSWSGDLAVDTNTLYVDATNNRVGIGTTTPSNSLHLYGSSSALRVERTVSDSAALITKTTLGHYGIGTGIGTASNCFNIYDYNASAEIMKIDSFTNCLFGKTADAKVAFNGMTYGAYVDIQHPSSVGSGYGYCRFVWNGGVIGQVAQSGTTGVTYNTSSDYRLKENNVNINDGISRVKLLKPYRFNFIAEPDTTVDGFYAHEVQSVVPEAITGTHNEVDDDGNPVYQGIDQSKLVPLLTAALQEAITKIEDLETRIQALENA